MYLHCTSGFIPVISGNMHSQAISIYLRFSTIWTRSSSVLEMSRFYMVNHVALCFVLLITSSAVPNSSSNIPCLYHQ